MAAIEAVCEHDSSLRARTAMRRTTCEGPGFACGTPLSSLAWLSLRPYSAHARGDQRRRSRACLIASLHDQRAQGGLISVLQRFEYRMTARLRS